MKKLIMAVASLALAASAASHASASVLYDNTRNTPYGTNAYSISAAFNADSFTLNAAATITDVQFDAWLYRDGQMTGVDWGIYDASPFSGGSVLASATGQATTTPATPLYTIVYNTQDYYPVRSERFSITPLSLAAGTYWLGLQNAASTTGGVYWDLAYGPSQALQNGNAIIASHGFQILGEVTTETSTAPEPAAWSLLILGFGGAGMVLRRRRTPQTA